MKSELRNVVSEFVNIILPPPISVLKECDLFKRCKKLHPCARKTDSEIFNSSLLTPHLSLNQLSRAAFTLAEVLITLVVLGIIAAVAVPILRGSLDDKRYIVPLKKSYYVLSEGLDEAFAIVDSTFTSTQAFREAMVILAERLGTNRKCCASSDIQPNFNTESSGYNAGTCIVNGIGVSNFTCFAEPDIGFTFLNKQSNPQVSFELKDGTSVYFLMVIEDIDENKTITKLGININSRKGIPIRYGNPMTNGHMYIVVFVDVNGKTGPNIAGKDIHGFVYTKSDGLLAAGSDTFHYNGITCSSEVWQCTYSFMNEVYR